MADTLAHIHGVPVLMCDQEGPVVSTEAETLDLIAAAGPYGHAADWVALPASRLPDDFFKLSNGFAGMLAQKFVNYGLGLAILGDVSARATGPAADWVRESNKGRHIWFATDVAELEQLLTKHAR